MVGKKRKNDAISYNEASENEMNTLEVFGIDSLKKSKQLTGKEEIIIKKDS